MSLLSWFSKKSTDKAPTVPQSSGLVHEDATVPLEGPGKDASKAAMAGSGSAANRKGERLERREQLYSVVRESMTGAGILSASYKFKVLSLDSRGRQYLIMMDVAQQYAGEAARLAEMEGLIAHNAKARYDIFVTAVYWRVNGHVSAGLTRSPVSAPAPLAADRTSAGSTQASTPQPRYEPLHADEVTAFKQALASAAPSNSPVMPGEIVRSGRRNPAPDPDFEDTEMIDRRSPLSGTQYGELN